MTTNRRLRRASRITILVVLALVAALVTAVVHESRGVAGSARYYGSAAALPLQQPIVDLAATPNGNGYWMVASDGGVFTFGNAKFFGSTGRMHLRKPIVGMAALPSGRGYWLVASDGGVFSFGRARFYGSTGGMRLHKPIVGMAASPTGRGYWLVASDGGIFTFGDAKFRGSTGAVRLFKPIVGMAATHNGRGYWLVASDGGVFTFGNAKFWGSTGGRVLNAPIVGMASDPRGPGYWLVSRDGNLFAYGGARFLGAPGRRTSIHPVVGMDAARQGGYWLATGDGGVFSATASGDLIVDPNLRPATRAEAMAEDMFERINAERSARGLRMLSWDGRLATLATNWSAHMGATNDFSHQNLAGLFNDASFAARYNSVRENIYNGTGSYADSGSAHVALMNSDPHRTTILTPQLQSVGIGVACVSGHLWVTQDFGTFVGNPVPGAMATPPRDPIARPSQDGPSC
jgi:ribosomal protein L24E